MNIEFNQNGLCLQANQVVKVRGGLGHSIVCERGSVWVTQDGDPRDVILHAGESFTLDRDGPALVQAFEPGAISVAPAGPQTRATGLAALLKMPERFKGKKVGLVLCGGNIDPLLLAAIIERGMVRSGRLARLRVSAVDHPGSLARITATVAEAGANIDEVHHQRAFTALSAQNVDIELVVQTRGRAHMADVLAALRTAGFEADAI